MEVVMVRTKVCLQGLLYQLLIVGLAIAISVVFSSMLAAILAFFGGAFLLLNVLSEWVVEDTMLSRYTARSLATKFFLQTFEVNPPSSRDWLAMNVCQRVVTDKLAELKRVRENLYEEENKRISANLTPKEVGERIISNRELHARVQVAKNTYTDAKWIADFFHFNTRTR